MELQNRTTWEIPHCSMTTTVCLNAHEYLNYKCLAFLGKENLSRGPFERRKFGGKSNSW
jgi:hypothetical protein